MLIEEVILYLEVGTKSPNYQSTKVTRCVASPTARAAFARSRLAPLADVRFDDAHTIREKGFHAVSAQKSGQLQPAIAVLLQECTGQLASVGPT
jgi:hypothetical protein